MGSVAAVLVVGAAWWLGAPDLPTPGVVLREPHETVRRYTAGSDELMEFNVHRSYGDMIRDPRLLRDWAEVPNVGGSGLAVVPWRGSDAVEQMAFQPGRVLWRKRGFRGWGPEWDREGEGWTVVTVTYRGVPGAGARDRREALVGWARRALGADEPCLAYDRREIGALLER